MWIGGTRIVPTDATERIVFDPVLLLSPPMFGQVTWYACMYFPLRLEGVVLQESEGCYTPDISFSANSTRLLCLGGQDS
jgi:hypothetical protein